MTSATLSYTPARAQSFDAENAQPSSPGDSALLSVQSTRTVADGDFAVSVHVDALDDALVATDPMTGERVGAVIHSRVGAHLGAAYGLGRLELTAALPLILDQSSQGMLTEPGATSAGAGDVRFGARARIATFGALSIAGGLAIALPTAARAEYAGNDGVGATATAVAQWRRGPMLAAVNVGARLREATMLGDLEVGSALRFGAGAAYRVLPDADVIAEVDGETGGASTVETPIEARGGARWWATPRIAVAAGYGRGVVDGYGAPDHRGFVQIAYRPPAERAPRRVTVLAVADPEPVPDPDGDGIRGDRDTCPDEAEDFDGFQDDDGCPDADNDGDGVADADDACANDLEDRDGWRDDDGCPDPDNDFDGLADADDACPNEAEIINNVDDDDGCPDEGKQLVSVDTDRIRIHERLYFANDQDVILPRSEPVLDQLAKTLARKPWLVTIRIEGHTDDRAGDAHNLDLSERRARSVRAALIERGVAADRLEAVGFGEAHPIDTNATVDGRANNRRVEFHIVEQTPAPGGDQ